MKPRTVEDTKVFLSNRFHPAYVDRMDLNPKEVGNLLDFTANMLHGEELPQLVFNVCLDVVYMQSVFRWSTMNPHFFEVFDRSENNPQLIASSLISARFMLEHKLQEYLIDSSTTKKTVQTLDALESITKNTTRFANLANVYGFLKSSVSEERITIIASRM